LTADAIGLGGRSVILIGLMGVGKSSIGKRLARRLDLPFVDADAEIVKAAGCSIEDIFQRFGEAAFREGEERVLARLLAEGPHVLATGGGAFMNDRTRQRIREAGISVWLRASLDILVKRLGRRQGERPLLKNGDLRETLTRLIDVRHPIYAEADVVVDTGDESLDATVEQVVAGLQTKLGSAKPLERSVSS
jgi:shikimate kinase